MIFLVLFVMFQVSHIRKRSFFISLLKLFHSTKISIYLVLFLDLYLNSKNNSDLSFRVLLLAPFELSRIKTESHTFALEIFIQLRYSFISTLINFFCLCFISYLLSNFSTWIKEIFSFSLPIALFNYDLNLYLPNFPITSFRSNFSKIKTEIFTLFLFQILFNINLVYLNT